MDLDNGNVMGDGTGSVLRLMPFERVIDAMSMKEYIVFILACSNEPEKAQKFFELVAQREGIDLKEKGWWRP